MDRYGLSCDIQSGMVREIPYPEGQWVKYSDVEQLQARVKELEEGAKVGVICGGEVNREKNEGYITIQVPMQDVYGVTIGDRCSLYIQALKGGA